MVAEGQRSRAGIFGNMGGEIRGEEQVMEGFESRFSEKQCSCF